MKKRIVWISLAAIVVIAGIVIIYIFNAPRNSVADKVTDFKVEVKDIVKEFAVDEEGANEKYTDKIIEVSGVIAEINISDTEGSNCILRQTDEISGVICEFEPGQDKELRNLEIGDNITIKGEYSGFLMDVVLNTCKIIE